MKQYAIVLNVFLEASDKEDAEVRSKFLHLKLEEAAAPLGGSVQIEVEAVDEIG
jgi:hypothetical protein